MLSPSTRQALLCAAVLLLASCTRTHQESSQPAQASFLTDAELRDGGWRSLASPELWRGYQKQGMPAMWDMSDGIITKSGVGEDIVTRAEYTDFELAFDWMLDEGGNSGLFYRATEEYPKIYWSAPEFALVDDAGHPDGRNPLTSAGAAHSLYAPPRGVVRAANSWNATRVVARGTHVEHWLNGQKVVEYDYGSDDFNSRVARSKFARWENFAKAKRGVIGLQGDHGGVLRIRHMRIRALAAPTVPVADSVVYPVYNHERVAGSMVVTTNADTTTIRYVFTDRNRGSRIFVRYVRRGADIISAERRPVLLDGSLGAPTSRMDIVGDSVRRSNGASTTMTARRKDAFYVGSSTPYDRSLLIARALTRPDRMVLLPSGDTARVDIVRTTTVQVGGKSEVVRLAALRTGRSANLRYMWIDSHNELFASEVAWFMTIRPDAYPALASLRTIETQMHDAAAEALNKRLMRPTSGVIAITNADLFDSETGTMRPRTTVLVRGDRIVAVGPSASTNVPAGATVIDATGKTLMPGMWDMHVHTQLKSQIRGGPTQLATGITTVRDLAADVDVAVAERDRAQAGLIASPRFVLAGFIEGVTKWAGPTATLVGTESEAREWVARYDSLGYKQVKLYNVVHPDLVPTITQEAHKRGMRVSGHIPRGLSVADAITLGFDEVNHAAFLFSTFYPDSLFVPTMRAYSAVATAVAPNIDVDGKPMTDLIGFLKTHNTVIEGTFAVWVQSAGNGIAQAVGAGVPTDVAKADANYMRLLKRLYDAGVTLVPGTDAYGSTTFNSELELFEQVGIPAPTVLQIATIVSARVMNDDKDYGSIAVGKVADMFIVNGKPAEHVRDLRNVEHVVRGGRLYDARVIKAELSIGNNNR